MVAFLLTACSFSQNTPEPTQTPASGNELDAPYAGQWIVNLIVTQSDGSSSVVTELSSSGTLLVVDEISGEQFDIQLLQEDLDKISELIDEVNFQEQIADPPDCSDCVSYELYIIKDSEEYVAIFNDQNMNRTGLKSIVKEMLKIQEESIPE